MQSKYEYRRSIGLCGRNGCNTWSDAKSLCPRHLEEQRIRSATAQYRKRYAGMKAKKVLNFSGVPCSRPARY